MAEKPYLVFRLYPANRFTFPVLLNRLERENLNRYFSVRVLENFSDLLSLVNSGSSGVILYSFMTPHLPQVWEELRQIPNNARSRWLLIAGGPHPSGDPGSTVKMGFDLVYAGAGETAFTAILRRYLQKELNDLPAIFFAPPLACLDESLPMTRYMKTMPPLEITRGCYWNCRFCQTAGQKAIHRSTDSIKQYYVELKKRGYHRRVGFICPSAFEYGAASARQLNPDAIEELLSFCRREGTEFLEFGIFPSETRPNTFREEMVRLIARYCSNRKITIGAQSGSDRLLKDIRRGHTVEDVERACEITSRYRLRPLVDMIFGFPGETPDDRHRTLRLMKHWAIRYGARFQVHYFLPLAGTPLQDTRPTPLDYDTVDTLRRYRQDGIATGWWETGQQLSRQLVELRERLKSGSAVSLGRTYTLSGDG